MSFVKNTILFPLGFCLENEVFKMPKKQKIPGSAQQKILGTANKWVFQRTRKHAKCKVMSNLLTRDACILHFITAVFRALKSPLCLGIWAKQRGPEKQKTAGFGLAKNTRYWEQMSISENTEKCEVQSNVVDWLRKGGWKRRFSTIIFLRWKNTVVFS